MESSMSYTKTHFTLSSFLLLHWCHHQIVYLWPFCFGKNFDVYKSKRQWKYPLDCLVSFSGVRYCYSLDRSFLVWVLACCLFSTEPLAKPLMNYCQLNHSEQIRNLNQNTQIMIQGNTSDNFVCKMIDILFRPWCTKLYITAKLH